MKISKKLITRAIKIVINFLSPKLLYPYYIYSKTKRKFKKIINNEKQLNKYQENLDRINSFEFKLTSQNNEDGIIDYIFKNIPHEKYFIEIGFGYYEFNSLNLIKNGWRGKLIDSNPDEAIALRKNLDHFFPKSNVDIINKKVTADNINKIITTNNKIDFFSLDIDSNDYWILKEMNLSKINVLCCEYNHWLGKEKKLTVPHDKEFKFNDNGIWGASLLALNSLLNNKGFSLIAVESSGTNAFFINNQLVNNFEILSPIKSFRSVGRFYNNQRKKEILDNIKKNSNKLIQV